MSKGLIIFLSLLLILPIIGFIVIVSKTNQPLPVISEITGLDSTPTTYNLGDMARLGGIVSQEFVLKNNSGNTLKLYRITTSCMCTKAKVVVNGQETGFFSMESPGDQNAPVNLEITPGAEARVVFQFDPNAHGPKGVGPIDRSIDLVFSDPQATKELKFNGTVI